MWVKEFYGYVDYMLEMEEYGVILYVYRFWWLFELQVIYVLFNGFMLGVIRVKGYFWMVICLDWVVEFLLVGVLFSIFFFGIWWVSVFCEWWLEGDFVDEYIKDYW